MKVCDEIRKVKGGYIVVVRAPYGDNCDGGEVICNTFNDVIALVRKAAIESIEEVKAEEARRVADEEAVVKRLAIWLWNLTTPAVAWDNASIRSQDVFHQKARECIALVRGNIVPS